MYTKIKNTNKMVRKCNLCEEDIHVDVRKCGGCREVFYCSEVCAVKDWKNGHKNTCSGRKSDGSGSNNKSSSKTKSESHKKKKTSDNNDIKICHNKKCSEVGVMRCSRCKQVWYCSKNCQLSDWKNGHKKKCKKYMEKVEKKAKKIIEKGIKYIEKSIDFTEEENNKKALKEGLKALEKFKHEDAGTKGDRKFNVANATFRVGNLYFNLGKYNLALKNQQEGLKALIKIHAEETIDISEKYRLIAVTYRRMEQYDKALEYASICLNMRRNELGDDHVDVADAHFTIARIHQKAQNFTVALEHSHKMLIIREKNFSKKGIEFANDLVEVGKIYVHNNELDEAVKIGERILNICLQNPTKDPKHFCLGSAFHLLGNAYLKKGNHHKSLEYNIKALKTLKRVHGDDENHHTFGSTYNSIATNYMNLNKFDEAISYLNRSLKIKKKVLGPDHIDLCSGYSNLGQIFYHRGDNLDDALECFGKVIKILKKVTGEKTLRVADTYELIGNIYKARSVEAFQAVIFDPSKKDHYKHLLDKSLEYTKKTLSIRTDILGPNDRKTKDAQEVLSWIIGLKEAPGTDW